jgi:hypothetical protein
MLFAMIQTFRAALRFPLFASVAALTFSGCSGAESGESNEGNTAPSNGAPADAAAAASRTNGPVTFNPSTVAPVTDPSDSATSPADNEAASDTEASAADTDSSPTDPDLALNQQGAPAISLGAAEGFAMLGSSTVTCTNSSAVVGDVGVSPGIEVTGFGSSCTVVGDIHALDAATAAAQADLLVAFDELGALECGDDLTGVELGGLTLPPGVYCFDTTAGLSAELTLDAGGDSNASWVFKVGSGITTGPGSAVTMAGGGDACNVFWRVGTSAVLGTTSSFKGNILASASVTLTSGSSLEGRALALNAAVTSDNNAISNCGR